MAEVLIPLLIALVIVPLCNMILLVWIVSVFLSAIRRRDAILDKRDRALEEALAGVRAALERLIGRSDPTP